MSKPKKVTEGDLIAALAKRYSGDGWAFLAHVRNGTGYSRDVVRTADALAMSLWPSRGLELHGFELKVSRSDWLRELKEPEKAEEIARYCHRWGVVVPDASIVQDGELPPAWGLLGLRGGKLVMAREAQAMPATPPDHAMLAAILRKATKGMVSKDALQALVAARVEGLEEAAKAKAERAAGGWQESYERLKKAVDEFEQASGVKISEGFGAGRVGAAVRLVLEGGAEAMERRRNRLALDARSLEELAAGIRKAIDEQVAERGAP